MKVFIYGTLLNHPTLAHALRRLPRISKGKLANVKEVLIKSYPTLEYAPGSVTKGEVFEVSRDELKRLDKWEDRYHRVEVTLSDGSTASLYLLKEIP